MNKEIRVGTRLLMCVHALDINITLERMSCYDTIIVNNDLFGKNNLYNKMIYLSRYSSFRNGAQLMLDRGVIDIILENNGFTFRKNESTDFYLSIIRTPYTTSYIKEIKKLHRKLCLYNDKQLIDSFFGGEELT